MHRADSDCTVDPATDACVTCGVWHGDPCPSCGGRGFHREGCSVSALDRAAEAVARRIGWGMSSGGYAPEPPYTLTAEDRALLLALESERAIASNDFAKWSDR